MAGEPLLHAKNVTIRFGGLTAVSDLNLEIHPRELVGLIGPNGAGKTTIFNMLTGVYKPTEGEIRIGGTSTREMKPYHITSLGVARTFQNIRLFKELTVLENVKIGGHIHYKYSGTSAVLHTNRFHEAEEAAEVDALKLLDIFGLRRRADDYATNLPYGDQRRLEIARALASEPRLLLLDEPTAGMSPDETYATGEMVKSLKAEGVTILAVEHDMAFVRQVADRVTVLHVGRIFAHGTIGEIVADERVAAIYLGQSHD